MKLLQFLQIGCVSQAGFGGSSLLVEGLVPELDTLFHLTSTYRPSAFEGRSVLKGEQLVHIVSPIIQGQCPDYRVLCGIFSRLRQLSRIP